MTKYEPIRSRIRRLAVAVVGCWLLGGYPALVAAQETGDIPAGRRLAETWCSACHVVGPSQQRGTSNGAPTFAAIARMKSTTSLSLHAFLQTPHDRMPDLNLSRDEIDNLVAYILNLRQTRPTRTRANPAG